MISKHISDLGDGLFVGSWLATKPETLKELNISVVVSIGCPPIKVEMNKIQFVCLELDDNTQSASKLFQIFPVILPYLHQKLKKGHKCLVHCSSGKSRSVSVLVGYLMKYKKMKMNEALDYIRTRRKCINPNEGFLDALEYYESTLT